MKTLPLLLSLTLALPVFAEKKENPYLSIQLEMKRAIERGNDYLKKEQDKEGFWREPKYPAFTALALTAQRRSPSYKTTPEIEKGFSWLLKQQKKDGGIYGQGLGSYNTATAVVALVSTGDKTYHPAILKARSYLIGQQADIGIQGDPDDKFDGGIGYGGTYKHSDLSNTYIAIEALRLSRDIAQDNANGKQPELNWDAAIKFISRTQNLKASSGQPDSGNDGSFNYFPGNSKAGFTENADGSKTLRGYGSMSYAGLLSMIYADLDAKDPRVMAVTKWAGANYSVQENPGLATKKDPSLGQQGLYYYYQAMAKALSAANIDKLPLKDGKEADWRRDIALEILKDQREDGSWVNKNSRWWESDPVLVTAYAMLTLEQIYYSIPEGN